MKEEGISVTRMTEPGFRITVFSLLFGIIEGLDEKSRARVIRKALERLQQQPTSFRPIPADAIHEIEWAADLLKQIRPDAPI